MGFKMGATAKVFQVDTSKADRNIVKLKISISDYDKKTKGYVNSFSDYVSVIGAVGASKAARLKEGDVITLTQVDFTRRYDTRTGNTYYNGIIWDFEFGRKRYNRDSIVWVDATDSGGTYGGQNNNQPAPAQRQQAQPAPETDPAFDEAFESNLPF